MRRKTMWVVLPWLTACCLVVSGQLGWAQTPAGGSLLPNAPTPAQPLADMQSQSNADQSDQSADGDACPPAGYGGVCAPVGTWFNFSADALFLNISKVRRQDLVLDQNTLATVLSTADLNLHRAQGPRLTATIAANQDLRFQVSYFGFMDWNTFAVAPGSNNLRLPGDIGLATDDFFGADHMRASYGVKLQTVEINALRRTINRNLSILGGFRYFSIMEHFDINSTDSDGSVSDYRTSTNNNLFGGQLGGAWSRRWGIFRLGLVGKAGVYGNNASQRTFLGDFGNTFVFRDSKTKESNVAFVGEINLNETIDITPNVFIRVGYNLIFISDIARAPDQLDFTDTPTSGLAVNNSGNMFLYGANIGAGCRF